MIPVENRWCKHGVHLREVCPQCIREIDATMRNLTWEPGDLSSHELETVLTDALADLWRDCYRQGNPGAQRQIFRERITSAVKNATGDEGVLRWTN